jgi:hypothetical protein
VRGQANHGPGVLRAAAVAAFALLALSVGLSLSYWPGVMTWDSIRQYGQALSGRFDDWHPPLMNWVWRLLLPFAHGPAPMLLLQLAIYGSGYALLVGWALKARRPRLAVALAAAALLPVAVPLMATIVKDSLMAALLLAAVGLLAFSRQGRDWPLRLLAALLVVLACALRFNAFPAGAPILVALLPGRLRDTPLKMAGAGLAAMALLLLPLPIANHALKAEKSGIGVALVIYDLGGITEHTRQDAFPPLPVRDPVAVNDICYTTVRWDPYADWGDPDCKVGWTALKPAFQKQHINPYLWWAKAVLAHPLAYAEHRLQHFNLNTRFLVKDDPAANASGPDEDDRPVRDRSVDNDWSIQVTPNPVLKAVDALAIFAASTPLGWPSFWMALALGLAILAPRLPTGRLVLPLALSSLLYGLGYAVVSVASELRYHLWTILAALLAALIAGADLPEAKLGRGRLLIAAAPAAVVVILGVLWRLGPG